MADITLFGLLNTGMLGVYTHKLAMNVVAHNVANTSTPGFSRQRPIITPTPPLPIATLTQTSLPIQIGTGSMVKTIERVRDEFLDVQYRQVNNRYNYWDYMASQLHYVEQLMGEPGDAGMRSLLDRIFNALKEINADPTNTAAKGAFVSATREFLTVIQDFYTRLEQLREDINMEIKGRIDQINNILSRLADLNGKIRSSMIIGATPNDLMDERDRLLDELSDLVDVSYVIQPDGQILLSIGDKSVLSASVYMELNAYTAPGSGGIYTVMVGNAPLHINDGKMRALLYLRDERLPALMKRLDEFMLFMVDAFNMIHRECYDASGNITGLQILEGIEAATPSENNRLFRIMGRNALSSGPVRYVTGLLGLTSDPSSHVVNFHRDKGRLALVSNDSVYNISIDTGSTLQDVLNIINDPTGEWYKWLRAGYENYESTNYRFYLYSPLSFKGHLIVDTAGGTLEALGLPVRSQDVITITREKYERFVSDYVGRSFSIIVKNKIRDEREVVDLTLSSDFDSFAEALKSSNFLKVVEVDDDQDGNVDFVHLIPMYADEFGHYIHDLDGLEIVDLDGLLTLVGAETQTLQALDTDNVKTLENLLDLHSASYLEVDYQGTPPTLGSGTLNFYLEDKTDGSSVTVNIDLSGISTLSDLVNEINTQLASWSNKVQAWTDGDVLRLVPLRNVDYSFDNIAMVVNTDDAGVFNGYYIMRLGYSDHAVDEYDSMGFPYEGSTREEIRKSGFNIVINSSPVEINPALDDMKNLVDKLNTLSTGLLADLSPHGRLVMRAGVSSNFDLKNFSIEAPREFLEKAGLLEDDGNVTWDTANLETLMDPTWEYDRIIGNLKVADILEIPSTLGITRNVTMNVAVAQSPSSLGVDLGKAVDLNGDWVVDTVVPVGASSTDGILELVDLKEKGYLQDGKESMGEFFGNMVAELGVEGETARNLKTNAEAMKKQIDYERERVKGVSIDEEMGNMIRYQHAFNASARVISAVDEMIGRIIDHLGVVGR